MVAVLVTVYRDEIIKIVQPFLPSPDKVAHLTDFNNSLSQDITKQVSPFLNAKSVSAGSGDVVKSIKKRYENIGLTPHNIQLEQTIKSLVVQDKK